MDLYTQWASRQLQGLLPDSSVDFLQQHVLHPDASLQILKGHVIAAGEAAFAVAWPLVAPTFERVMAAIYASPDVVFVATFLLLLVAVVQILNFTRRVLMFLTRLVFYMALWAGLAAVAAIVWKRGLEASVGDAVRIGSTVVGYAAGVRDIFLREYAKYDAQEKARAGATAGAGRRW
ncbi:hypothetical protein B0T22DRAFT_476751 [Podospora appendiculata]|uniref:Uncharacterized protein n=1 Tax=Podospora appendiculata TaxID=314037 RepID=A0AAE0XJ90_9PEZI|nr:hypothetical protein B0T22DRAFT_476751 [Podospora appendiculata]